jgi:hypothetical protein
MIRQCSWYLALNAPPLHPPQEAIRRRCLLTSRLQLGHSATHLVEGATTERSQYREPSQPSSFAFARHTRSWPCPDPTRASAISWRIVFLTSASGFSKVNFLLSVIFRLRCEQKPNRRTARFEFKGPMGQIVFGHQLVSGGLNVFQDHRLLCHLVRTSPSMISGDVEIVQCLPRWVYRRIQIEPEQAVRTNP